MCTCAKLDGYRIDLILCEHEHVGFWDSMFDTEHCQHCDNVTNVQFILQGCVGRLMATQEMTFLVEECQLIGLKPGGRWLLSSGSAVLYVCLFVCVCGWVGGWVGGRAGGFVCLCMCLRMCLCASACVCMCINCIYTYTCISF